MKFRDLPAAQFGRYGEAIAARMFRNLGAGVIATFKFSGENDNEAPAIELSEKRIVLPDLDVSMRGKTLSVEIKTYKEPQRNRTHYCLVHGIPTRLFDEYVASEQERGIPVHLGILEVDSGALLVSNEPISKITPRYPCDCHNRCESVRVEECEFRKKWGNSYPQWYFRRDTFTEWHRLAPSDLETLQAEHAKVSSKIRKAEPHHRPKGDTFKAKPWTWACLPCNATGTGSSETHRCPPNEPTYRIDFWIKRLAFADDLRTLTPAQRAAAIARPVSRAQMVKWLGAQWSPDKDVR